MAIYRSQNAIQTPDTAPSTYEAHEEQKFVDAYSFAGNSNGRTSPDGEPMFWPTQTFRGPGGIHVGEQIPDDMAGIEPSHNTIILVKSQNETNVFWFTGHNRNDLKVSHFRLETIEEGLAPYVEKKDDQIYTREKVITVQLDEGDVMKIVRLGERETSAPVVARFDSLHLDDTQVAEEYAMYNAIMAIRDDMSAQENIPQSSHYTA